jgi:dihydroorotase-like cyclic amidohydrolase
LRLYAYGASTRTINSGGRGVGEEEEEVVVDGEKAEEEEAAAGGGTMISILPNTSVPLERRSTTSSPLANARLPE